MPPTPFFVFLCVFWGESESLGAPLGAGGVLGERFGASRGALRGLRGPRGALRGAFGGPWGPTPEGPHRAPLLPPYGTIAPPGPPGGPPRAPMGPGGGPGAQGGSSFKAAKGI